MTQDVGGEIAIGFTRRLGAKAARTLVVKVEELGHSPMHGLSASSNSLGELLGLHCQLRTLFTLGGEPISCVDLRNEARRSASEGCLLVVDNTLASSYGCAALRLGANVCLERLDRVMGETGGDLLAITFDTKALRLFERPSSWRDPSTEELDSLVRALETFDARRRKANDCAQVLAAYLTCHPKVEHVYYPGLKGDASFKVASSILSNGFGPMVDYESQGACHRIDCLGHTPQGLIEALERTLAACSGD